MLNVEASKISKFLKFYSIKKKKKKKKLVEYQKTVFTMQTQKSHQKIADHSILSWELFS